MDAGSSGGWLALRQLVALAWRNCWRQPRRAGLTVATIALGVAALGFAWALFDGANSQAVRAMTGLFTGHLQVQPAAWRDEPSLDLAFPADALPAERLARLPGVRAVAPRLEGPVLLSSASASRGVLLTGIAPAAEADVTTLHQRRIAGRWLDASSTGGIVIGRSLAQALQVQPGDELAVLTQGMHGSIGAARYRVAAVYDSGNEMIDGLQAFVALADAQTLWSAEGRLTGWVLRLDQAGAAAALLPVLRPLVQAASPQGQAASPQGQAANPPGQGGLVARDWAELLPDLAQKVAFHEWIARIVMLMLFGIVGFGLTSAVTMSTFERTREFGVLLALGLKRRLLFTLVVMEGALLGLAGFAIGIALAAALVAHVGSAGIDFSAHRQAVQQMPGIDGRIHPLLSLERALGIGSAVFIVAVLAAVLPAWKAARLAPIDALRRGVGTRVPTGGGAAVAGRWLVLALAWRNLGRHPLRSAATVLGVVFALASVVFLGGFLEGYSRQIIDNATAYVSGDLQLQHRDFQARLDPALALDDADALLAALRQRPAVRAAAPRLQTPGLVSSPRAAQPVRVQGVVPEQERAVSRLHAAVSIGRYLEEGRPREAVIGARLAERLKIDLGDKLIVTVPDAAGQVAAEALTVVGLFDTGSHGFDESLVQLPLPTLQRLLGLPGRTGSIAVRLHDPAALPSALADVRTLLHQPEAVARGWAELMPEVQQMTVMLRGSLTLVMALIFATAVAVLVNATLMSVLERTREFGTLLALGAGGGVVLRIVLVEAALLAGIGALVGLAWGTGATWAHMGPGIGMQAHGLSSLPGAANVVHPQLSLATTLQPALLLPLLIVVAAVLPAWRATRLQPAQACRAA